MWRIERIYKRKSNEKRFNANLHGMKLDDRDPVSTPRELTDDEKKALELAKKKAEARIKLRRKQRNDGSSS